MNNSHHNIMNNLQKYEADLEALIQLGNQVLEDLLERAESGGEVDEEFYGIDIVRPKKDDSGSVGDSRESMRLEQHYQRWYTEASSLVRQLCSDRLDEFQHLYKAGSTRAKEHPSAISFTIQDWLNGLRSPTLGQIEIKRRFDDIGTVAWKFKNQVDILESLKARFTSSLFDIQQLVQADLFDSEIEASRELGKRGFLRAAGTIAGVVLEKHLAQTIQNHNLKQNKRNPTISDLNQILKDQGVLDVPTWRQIQRLGDLRNYCSHNKERDPTKDEVEELIDGVEKQTKTLF